MHKVVDNEDIEELKKVIEKKSIQKKSSMYVPISFFMKVELLNTFLSLIHNIQYYWQIEKVDY